MDMEKLKVYYGWSKINAVRKKRSLSVMFENDLSCRRDRGQRVLSATQDTVFVRYQDEEEMTDAKAQNRIFTGYDLFLDENRLTAVWSFYWSQTAKRIRTTYPRTCASVSPKLFGKRSC